MCVCVCVFCAAYMRVHTRLEKKNVQTCSCDLKKKGKRKKRTGNHGSYVNEGKGKKKQYNSPQNGGSTRLRCKRRNKVQSVMLISGSLRKAVTVLLRHTHTHMRLSKCEKKKSTCTEASMSRLLPFSHHSFNSNDSQRMLLKMPAVATPHPLALCRQLA